MTISLFRVVCLVLICFSLLAHAESSENETCEFESAHVVLALDLSGSMYSNEKLVKDAASHIIGYFSENNKSLDVHLAILGYNDNVFTLLPFDSWSKSNLNAVKDRVKQEIGHKIDGSTDTSAALDRARQMLASKSNPIAILVSDGIANTLEATQRSADRLRNDNIPLFTVYIENAEGQRIGTPGISYEKGDKILEKYATKPSYAYKLKSTDDLSKVFDEIILVHCLGVIILAWWMFLIIGLGLLLLCLLLLACFCWKRRSRAKKTPHVVDKPQTLHKRKKGKKADSKRKGSDKKREQPKKKPKPKAKTSKSASGSGSGSVESKDSGEFELFPRETPLIMRE